MSVVIETTIGDLTVDLYTETRPRSCLNFLKLCKMKYYNFSLIYSIERNFIAQTGDPTASGKGGESIYHKMYGDQAKYYEGEKLPIMKHTRLGTVSMVSCGNHLFGSQFFITLGEDLDSLDSEHLVFGQVVEGLEVINKLNQTLTDEKNRPYQDIRITHMVVLEDPYRDPKELQFPDESPEPTREVFESDYIAADEAIDDTEGKSMTEINEEIQDKEAKARATILEMVGDLPDSDIAPPENVLFICKLNPVTTSEDLEIIFSRFGKIKSCEVIRDRVTDNSLQYAFVEFAETKSCEDAYFKMDNVLIDDRRVHVDFSQSVSKIKWRGKGRGVEYYDEDGRKVDDRKGRHVANQSYSLRGRNRPGAGGMNERRTHESHRDDRRHIQQNYQHADRPSQTRLKDNTSRGNEGRGTHQHHRDDRRKYEDTDRTSQTRYKDQHRSHRDDRGDRYRDERHDANRYHRDGKAPRTELEREVTNDPDLRDKMVQHLKKSIKKKKRRYSSDTSSEEDRKWKSESESESSEEERRKKWKKGKKGKKERSDSDEPKRKRSKKDKKKKKKKKNKKKKYKSSSSSSESSD